MGELTPDAAALIRSGRGALRPEASDRERVLRSLQRTLGEGAFVDEPRHLPRAGNAAAARFSAGWVKIVGGLSTLAIGVGLVAVHPWTSAPPRARPVPAASTLAIEPRTSPTISPGAAPSSEDERAPEPPAIEHGAAAVRPHASSRSNPDLLDEEVRLLSKAERQLSGGSGEDALRTLAEHERRFPRGALAEERMAAQVEALCALGRFGEAKTDLSRLSRTYPRSPHLESARRFCGSNVGGP